MAVDCRRILIIEPEKGLRSMLERQLRARNYEVVMAADADEAFDQLLAEPLPDVILLELNLPRVNGWQFLAMQKSTPRISSIPTLVYSEGTELSKRLPGRYIEKRADFSELLESLDRICAEHEAREKPVPADTEAAWADDPPWMTGHEVSAAAGLRREKSPSDADADEEKARERTARHS